MFEITHQDKNSLARAGLIHTAHGDIETPVFMPVGTQATVKALDSADLENLGAQIILANTYHLHLRPGEDLIAKFGGLHKFMNWNHPILTDSGGFQVFSLGLQKDRQNNIVIPSDLPASPCEAWRAGVEGSLKQCKRDSSAPPFQGSGRNDSNKVQIDNNGVTFRSHIDGSLHRFTPESAIEIQHKLGADIIMAFDECTADRASLSYAWQAMERTHQWAVRSLKQHQKLKANQQYLFGIIQGSNFKHLREESARFISGLDFDGIAIGGETIGYNMPMTKKIMDWIEPLLPKEKPRYTMGVGFSPADLFTVVELGIDMFDCVAPTRMARNGSLFCHPERSEGSLSYRLNIFNAKYKEDKRPIDPSCACPTCQNYSRAYLNHLFRADELLALRLASLHNVRFMLKLMEEIRQAIKNDSLKQLKKRWL